jgi:hypothetical protein
MKRDMFLRSATERDEANNFLPFQAVDRFPSFMLTPTKGSYYIS